MSAAALSWESGGHSTFPNALLSPWAGTTVDHTDIAPISAATVDLTVATRAMSSVSTLSTEATEHVFMLCTKRLREATAQSRIVRNRGSFAPLPRAGGVATRP